MAMLRSPAAFKWSSAAGSRLLAAGNNNMACCSLLLFDINRSLSDQVKYPIQEWGYSYLQKQKALNRPISPHLTVYAPDWSWSVSGMHRIFGVGLGVAAAIFTAGLMVMPFDFTSIVEYCRSLGVPSPVWGVLKFVLSFMIIFHAINGGFDLAKGMGNQVAGGTGIPAIVNGAKGVVAVSLLLAFVVSFVMPYMK